MRLLIIALVVALATTGNADCILGNSTLVGNVTTELVNPFYTITFDDLGFPSSGWGWIYSSQGPLHITHGQQNITLSGETCRVFNGYSGFYTTSWSSNNPWQGDTNGTIGDFMIVGSGSGAGNCLFEVSPPISAFTMRLSSTPAPSVTYIEVFDVQGSQIDCITSLPLAQGTNGYSIVGVYSNTPIGSFSAVVGSTGIIQVDNIQLLTCSSDSFFYGSGCVRKSAFNSRNHFHHTNALISIYC